MKMIKCSSMLFFLIVLISCQKTESKHDELLEVETSKSKELEMNKIIGVDDFLGLWKFKDPYPSENLVEDNYMSIEMVDSTLIGKYFGTTDDFDDSREGYFPGFFVSKMEELSVNGDSIKFKLRIFNDRLFQKPVPVSLSPDDKIDLPKWKYGVTYYERDYVGYLTKKGIEFDIYLRRERVFVKQ